MRGKAEGRRQKAELPCGAFYVLGGIWLGVAVKDAPNRVARVRSEAFGAGGDR